MRVSIIIISRSPELPVSALAPLSQLEFSPDKIEILLAYGSNPAMQRNEAARAAHGDYLLFLDDDSIVDPKLLHYYADALEYEKGIGVVGGPSVHKGRGGIFTSTVRAIFSSVFGLGPFRSRYVATGKVRRTTEQELILCNLLIRRDLFLREGGFHSDFYPNEENEFLNRVAKKTLLYYHPLAICYRFPRTTFGELVQQMFRYGEGRARNLIMFPAFWSPIFFLPVLFTLYLIFAPLGLWFVGMGYCAPGAIYFAISLGAAVFAAIGFKKLKIIALFSPLVACCHFFYGVGLLAGFARYPFAPAREQGTIEVRRVQAFKQSKLTPVS